MVRGNAGDGGNVEVGVHVGSGALHGGRSGGEPMLVDILGDDDK